MLLPRQRSLLRLLLGAPHSRAQLQAASGLRMMTLSADVSGLLGAGILRECGPRKVSRGRPEVPLEIDPLSKQVAGLLIAPGRVEVGTCDLLGNDTGEHVVQDVAGPDRLVPVARGLLRRAIGPRTLAVGVAVPGFIDAASGVILKSAAWPESAAALPPFDADGLVRLQPLRDLVHDLAPGVGVIIENDLHALAARWQIDHPQPAANAFDDTLVVYYDDGQLGATLLVNGRPNRGCMIGANELGHTRVGVDSGPCFCGGHGCLERAFSTAFYRKEALRLRTPKPTAKADTLKRVIERYDGHDVALDRLIELLATGVSNAVNFTRVGRVVLASHLNRNPIFFEKLVSHVRGNVFSALAQRVAFVSWAGQARSASSAAALALAALYFDGWQATEGVGETPARPAVGVRAVRKRREKL